MTESELSEAELVAGANGGRAGRDDAAAPAAPARAGRRRPEVRGETGPYRGAGAPGPRTRCFEAAVRGYLERRPEATVVALGEGLGTGFWRLDNGRLTWLTVQPPEAAAVRRMLLPDGARRRTVARAVSDHGWLNAVREPRRGVIVMAQGALMRLAPLAVRALLAACAERFPDGVLVFDALPRSAAALARRGAAAHRLSGGRWPAPARWGLDRAELPRLASVHPHIAEVRELGVRRAVYGRLPVLREVLPLVCEVRFAGP
ncbi:class I SAM-dependent methyltransferase [Streptomyces piniterrae]|uniref:class I SAM-dependent methyltransferase n=1 Tax=Streptomyces piniterrae TaxID=2571125 RepID=UPI001FE61939|nr:class I SAM-dependent methyltransferase [Streptomyces piniterrae]